MIPCLKVSVDEWGNVVHKSHHEKIVINLSEIVADTDIAAKIA
jgi:metal-dependent HD superfamily phosphatase/phosphodiesterase